MVLHIQLERFEGPLGLLLHLIRKEEMDIFDINIHHITRQYLDYIKSMKKLDLEVAGEFVAMASTLIHIKSKMLLPQYNEEGEVIENEDPRKELVQKLLEYQKYKEASERLYERPLVGRDVWLRGERLDVAPDKEGDIIVEDNALFALISSYRAVVRAMKTSVHKVMTELQSISERILEIKDRLIVGRRIVMKDLITAKEKASHQVLVTFLSLLELAKMGFVSVFQSEAYADIYIETKRAVERDVIARVESYDGDSMGAQRVAEDIFAQAAEVEQEQNFVEMATDEDILAEEERLEAIDRAVANND